MADRQSPARQWFRTCWRRCDRHRRGVDRRLASAALQLSPLERPHGHDHRIGDRRNRCSGCSALGRGERMGRRPVVLGGSMFKHILIPTDGSDLSRKAILYGVQLAKKAGAKVTGLTVTEPYQPAGMDTVFIPMDEGDYEEQSRVLSEK